MIELPGLPKITFDIWQYCRSSNTATGRHPDSITAGRLVSTYILARQRIAFQGRPHTFSRPQSITIRLYLSQTRKQQYFEPNTLLIPYHPLPTPANISSTTASPASWFRLTRHVRCDTCTHTTRRQWSRNSGSQVSHGGVSLASFYSRTNASQQTRKEDLSNRGRMDTWDVNSER